MFRDRLMRFIAGVIVFFLLSAGYHHLLITVNNMEENQESNTTSILTTAAPSTALKAAPTTASLYVPLTYQTSALRQARRCTEDPPNHLTGRVAYRERLKAYLEAHRCLGIGHTAAETETTWSNRLPKSLVSSLIPSMFPIHGGVRPFILVEQARQMALLMGMGRYVAGLTAMLDGDLRRPSKVQDGIDAQKRALGSTEEALKAEVRNLRPKDVIVELGCGNAGLLFLMCPPVKELACFGTDFALRLIEHGQRHIPWIDLRVDIFAPHLPTGSASGVLSHGTLIVLTPPQACSHMKEVLRLMKPRGLAVIWGNTPKPFRSQFHPSFFHEYENGTVAASFFDRSQLTVNVTSGRFLQFCPALGQYVRSMKFLMRDDHHKGPPLLNLDYEFGVVMERSHVEWKETTAEGSMGSYPTELPLDVYRRHVDYVEPFIREPEGISRYSDDAGVSSLRHYMTLANSTALHMHKCKTPDGAKYWCVSPQEEEPPRRRGRPPRRRGSPQEEEEGRDTKEEEGRGRKRYYGFRTFFRSSRDLGAQKFFVFFFVVCFCFDFDCSFFCVLY